MDISSERNGTMVESRMLILSSDLPAAIHQCESLRKKQNVWPPDNKETDPSGKGLIGIMDDELGFVD